MHSIIDLKKIFNYLLILTTTSTGCRSYNIKPNITTVERFKIAKQMFSKRDYFEAKSQFKILTLNNPGSPFVDEAQFFLAESHFNLKEYILAADEYNRLFRLYPNSKWADQAQFKIGMCAYKLSPKYSLDQKYTFQAIESFQGFIENFPDSDLVPEAEKLLNVCRTKLAKKEFKTGELYRKLHDYYAALVYFNSILDNYYDTKFATDALYWKAECLHKLERNDESHDAFTELIQKYPDSRYSSKAKSRIEELASNITKIGEANDVPTLNDQKN
ncbi:MAG: outer membrane protein assembly factor BamD [bacterium]